MPTTYKSDIQTKNDAALTALHNGLLDGDDRNGLLLVAQATYTLTGSEVANDIIQLFKLPAGAVIIPALSSVQCSADPGTTLTLNVGDTGSVAAPGFDAVSADPDRYAAGIVLSAGGQIGFCSTGVPDAAVNPFRPKVGNQINAVVASANTLTAAVKLIFTIVYRIKG